MESRTDREYVYTLQLSQGRFYVGMTAQLSFRIAQHWSGQGAKFSQRFKPICVLSVIEAAPGCGRALEQATYAAAAEKFNVKVPLV